MQETQRRMLCTLSTLNFSCSLDNQAPHGYPPATTVPKGLCCAVDEKHYITVAIDGFIMPWLVS